MVVEMSSQSELCMSRQSVEVVHETSESSTPLYLSRPVSPSTAVDPSLARAPSSKSLKGYFLSEEYSVYDIDKQLPGEAPQHLEVLPISVYGSAFVAGRQIVVNRRYICYCLRPGSIRILSRSVPTRGLFQGHSQRVTDMAFFAESVHLLASASSNGQLLIWKILENHAADGKVQLSEQILLAIQFDGEWKELQPRVCWHPHSQDWLMIGINKYVLKIDLNEVRMKAGSLKFTAETFLKCHIRDLISGVQLIGQHDDDVTDLTVLSSNILCIASASKDGTVRIWGGKQMNRLAVFQPYEGQPVGSVAFISTPNQPNEAVLLTGGPMNHSLKLWVPANQRGFVDGSTWHSVQTLEFKSSADKDLEQSFFNQVCVVSQAGLVLLGNTKKHALYSLRLDFGSSALATRMVYLVEFAMSMPILSLTAMAAADTMVNCKGIIQVFCVQTQVIQQVFLNVSLCIPPQDEESCTSVSSVVSTGLDLSKTSAFSAVEAGKNNLEKRVKNLFIEERAESVGTNPSLLCEHNLVPDSGSGFGSWVEVPNWVAATLKKTPKTGAAKDSTDLKDTILTRPLSPLAPFSKSPVSCEPHAKVVSLSSSSIADNIHQSVVHEPSNLNSQCSSTSALLSEERDNLKVTEDALASMGAVTSSSGVSTHVDSKKLSLRSDTTPSKLMAMACFEAAAVVADKRSKSAKHQDTRVDSHAECMGLDMEAQTDAGMHQSRTCSGSVMLERSGQLNLGNRENSLELYESEVRVDYEKYKSSHLSEETVNEKHTYAGVARKCKEQEKKESVSMSDCSLGTAMHSNNAKKKKRKNKTRDSDAMPSTIYSLMSDPVSVLEETSLTQEEKEDKTLESVPSPRVAAEDLLVQVQDSFDELLAFPKELQRHVSMAVGSHMSLEINRLESAFEKSLVNSLQAHLDSSWSKVDEEKRDKEALQQECFQQLMSMVTNFVEKDIIQTFRNVFNTEGTLTGSNINELATSNVDAVILMAMPQHLEVFHEKIIRYLDRSLSGMLNVPIQHQVQSLFAMLWKHLLQDNLLSCLQEQALPKFQSFCGDMSEQACALLSKELSEYAMFEEQAFGVTYIALASAIKDTLASSSSSAASLIGDLQDGEKRIEIHNSADLHKEVHPSEQSDNSFSITATLARFLQENQLEEAFMFALSVGSVAVVFWLCKQVDPISLFAIMPPPLSQGVLLSLIQQLSCDLGNGSSEKLTWIQHAALALKTDDYTLGPYMRSFLEQVYQNLQHQMFLFSHDTKLVNQARLLLHVVNSLLVICK